MDALWRATMSLVIDPREGYPRHLARVLAALETDRPDAAAAVLGPLAYQPEPDPPHRSVPRSLAFEVFERDRWTCRYCGRETVFIPVMALLGRLFPQLFPYHPDWNWKASLTHPAVPACGAVIDDARPGYRSAPSRNAESLVTACWPCQARKANFTRDGLTWSILPVPATDWDGLTRYIPTGLVATNRGARAVTVSLGDVISGGMVDRAATVDSHHRSRDGRHRARGGALGELVARCAAADLRTPAPLAHCPPGPGYEWGAGFAMHCSDRPVGGTSTP